jgi:hypothetical protein
MNAKLLFEDKIVDVVIDQLPTLQIEEEEDPPGVFKPKLQSWLPIKVDKNNLWVGKKDVFLEYDNDRFRLNSCSIKDGNLIFKEAYNLLYQNIFSNQNNFKN